MRYIAIFFLFLCLAAGYVAYDAYRFVTTPAEQPGVDVSFEVERGATFDRVVWDLKKAGLITDVKRFQLLGRYKKALGSIKAGEYILSTSLTPPQVLEQLLKGQAHLVRLTIREGLSWWDTASTIEKQGFATYEDFKDVIHDPDFLARHAIPFDNAEGFLFPDTYLLNKPKKLDRQQAEYIASLLVRTFWQKSTPFWRLLDASPAPDATFGQSVNDITSKTTVNTLRELAAYSHLVVMRAPLPLEEESAIAYENGDILEDESDEGEAKRDGPTAPDSNGPESNGSESAPANTADTAPANAPEVTPTENTGSSLKNTPPSDAPADNTANTPENTIDGPADTSGNESGSKPESASNGTPKDTFESNPAKAFESAPQKTPGDTLASESTSQHGGKSDDKSGTTPSPTAGARLDSWPTGALPESMPKHPPQTPAEIDKDALRQALTLASLVEKETGLPTERPRVAGVYANRIQKNMLLQCDPTIIYGIGPSFSGPIRRSQLRDSTNLYNTYIHPGLPPSPICSFGVDAFASALLPEKHTYIYFVATGLGKDHTFSKTLREHNRAVSVYRARVRGK